MTPQQIERYKYLVKRREQLANFIYISDFAFSNNDLTLYAAVETAKNTIQEIDNEISKL